MGIEIKGMGISYQSVCLKFFSIFVVFQLGFVSFSWAEPTDSIIRINILKNQEEIIIQGRKMTLWDPDTQATIKYPGKVLRFHRSHFGLKVGNRDLVGKQIVIRAKPSSFQVGPNHLEGELQVIQQKNGQLSLINLIHLERYLVGLINHEISSSWPLASLKAQAVAARTYALFRKHQSARADYDLESTVLDQVYGGTSREDKRSYKAVRSTLGQVLIFEGEVIAAFYHSCCGGHTEHPQHVWGENFKGLTPVSCQYCTRAPHYFWSYEISPETFERKLTQAGFPIDNMNKFRILQASLQGRALLVGVSNSEYEIKISGNQLRRAIGFDKIRSTQFRVEMPQEFTRSNPKPGEVVLASLPSESSLRFMGGGNGHGVGMCQWGARGMADEGYSYQEILKHYYPDTRLRHPIRYSQIP